ncbi:hypothetical protein [Microcoleus sp. AT3-D2]|uniref:hypothetical protein n=1 Tax=Microcoleus sp. AT3-D2 TaxID=2818612 RepID=UPI002FCF4E01
MLDKTHRHGVTATDSWRRTSAKRFSSSPFCRFQSLTVPARDQQRFAGRAESN